MGIKLLVEVMDHAPDTLSSAEHRALMILAEDANEKTRMLWREIDDPVLLRRLRMTEQSFANMRSALRRKGCLEMVGDPHRGSRPKYRIPVFAQVKKVHEGDEPFEGERLTEAVNLSTGKVHEGGEERFIEAVKLPLITPPSPSEVLPPPPPTPSTPPARTEDGGGGISEPDTPNATAAVLVDALPLDRPPGARQHRDLTAAVAAALADGWSPEALRVELERDLDTARVRTAVWLDRLRPENLKLAKRIGGAPAQTTASRPPWCGRCDERTRLVEVGDDGRPAPCGGCHPSAVPTVAPSRNALLIQAARVRAQAAMAAGGAHATPGERWSA